MHGYHFSGISGNLEMSGNLAEIREKSGKRPEVRKCQRIYVVKDIYLIVTAEQNNLPVLNSYYNSFFVRDVHGVFGLIKCAFVRHIARTFVREKSGIIFSLESGKRVNNSNNTLLIHYRFG